jgi:multisubunit Na+/H+ antiporter MnhB subunit
MDVLTVLKSQWDRIAAVACAIGGVILLIVGYQGIADSPYVAEELAYLISGGLGGVFLLGIGATLYVSADMHDEWRKLDRIEEAILSLRSDSSDGPAAPGRFDDIVDPVAESRASRHRANGNANVTAGVAQRSRQGEPRPGNVLAMPRELLIHLRVGGLAMALAFVALMLAYYRAADVSESRPAFSATAWAATVLAVTGVVAAGGMVRMRRQLMRRRNALLSGFLNRPGLVRDGGAAPRVAGEPAARMPERLLVIPEGRFAHVPSCAMVRGERTETVSSAALPGGILPCAICTPAAL